tara:strand:- start:192 stop:653 length:462 start_codon:yes stop_codon:yes gene_type:complete
VNPLLMNMLNYGVQQAPRIVQPLQRGITTLQNYLSPYANMIFNQAVKRPGTSGTMIPFAMSEPANVISNLVGTNTAEAAEVDDSMPPSDWMDELIEEEIERENKKKETKKEKKKEKKKELKKGGYVKKQRKRKHYRASGFVKMKKKKKKKYIT